MDDLISRQAAIKELCETYEHEYPTASGAFDEYATRIVPNVLRNLPSADVRPVRRGEWTGDVCSVCGVSKYNFFHFDSHASPFGIWNFCPRCGADMRGGDAK